MNPWSTQRRVVERSWIVALALASAACSADDEMRAWVAETDAIAGGVCVAPASIGEGTLPAAPGYMVKTNVGREVAVRFLAGCLDPHRSAARAADREQDRRTEVTRDDHNAEQREPRDARRLQGAP